MAWDVSESEGVERSGAAEPAYKPTYESGRKKMQIKIVTFLQRKAILGL